MRVRGDAQAITLDEHAQDVFAEAVGGREVAQQQVEQHRLFEHVDAHRRDVGPRGGVGRVEACFFACVFRVWLLRVLFDFNVSFV